MTPLKVGEPFLETDGNPEPSRTQSGRCRDWTGGTFGASHGEGTVQTTNIREDGGESRSGRLIRGLWVRSPQGPPHTPVTMSIPQWMSVARHTLARMEALGRDDGRTASSASPPALRRCGTCRAAKPLADFNRKSTRSDGLQETCRECNRAASRRYYRENRAHHIAVIRARTDAQREASQKFIAAYLLTHPCVDCGAADLRILDFDHRPDSGKRDAVMQLVRNGFSVGVIGEEIAKCDVRCRNCHAIVTHERIGDTWRSRAMQAIPPST
jgi:hypothetical protein